MPFPVCLADRFGRTTHKTETSALASLSSSASVSAERVSPACPPLAPFPAPEASIPVLPYWDVCPSGSLLLLQLLFTFSPFTPRSLPASPLLWAVRLPRNTSSRVSQVPRLIDSHAPPPTTPESPMAAFTPLLHHRWQASSASTDWPLSLG